MRHVAWGITPILLCSALSLLGCNSGGSTPAAPSPAIPQATSEGDLQVAAHAEELPLAMAHLRIDPASGSVDVSPLRLTSAVGDAYLVGLNALRRNFHITSVTRQTGPGGEPQLALDCEFSHPFSATSRPDLTGWDLKAILASDRDPQVFPGAGVTVDASLLANAAGYTTEWTPEILAAVPAVASTAFPYIILGEDRTTPAYDFQNPAGWNTFPPGATNTGTLVLNLGVGETIDVDVFFTVGYQVSATRATRQSPDYQPPRGNMRAAWRVDANVTSNELTTSTGTFASVDLNIWDWQHGQSLGSDVAGITVYAPELNSTPVTPPLGTGSGRDADPLTASFTVTNTLGTLTDPITYALVEVRDALDGANPGGGLGQPGVGVVEDDFTTIRTIDAIRTYQVIPLSINNLPGLDPVACVTSTPPLAAGMLSISKNTTVQWNASCSSDPDPTAPENTIAGWEWDFDWDGNPATFTDDRGGAGTVAESHQYTTPTTTHLGLRVKDGVGRKSPILDIPIEVLDQLFVLTLDPIVDLTCLGEDLSEHGAALAETSGGTVGVGYTGYISGPGSIQTYNSWNGSSWTYGSNNFSTSDGAETGWFAKASPNWMQGDVLMLDAITTFGSHAGYGFSFGYLSPHYNTGYGIPLNYSYGTEVCGHRTNGMIFAFGDESNQLKCWFGGPNRFDLPSFSWTGGAVTPNVIDARPSNVSRSRSAESAADNSVHIAYRAADGSQVRYAKNAGGDNVTWATQDLQTASAGTFGDPAFSLDESGSAFIAVTKNLGGGSWQIQLLSSSDLGGTWSAPQNVGTTFSVQPTDIALSVRQILGLQVVCVGYTTSTHPALSEFRVRWTADNGASWHDDLLSAGADAYSPDLLLSRSGGELYGAWSAADSGGRDNVMVRRAVPLLASGDPHEVAGWFNPAVSPGFQTRGF